MTEEGAEALARAVERLTATPPAADGSGARAGCTCSYCAALRRDHDLVEALTKIARSTTKRYGRRMTGIAAKVLDKYGIHWEET